MPIVIPIQPGIPDQTLDGMPINGAAYNFEVLWNARDREDPCDDTQGAWSFSVFEDDGTPIVSGVKIVLGAYLGRGVTHPLFTDGVFVAKDKSKQKREAKLDDITTRVEVRYYTLAELWGSDADGVV